MAIEKSLIDEWTIDSDHFLKRPTPSVGEYASTSYQPDMSDVERLEAGELGLEKKRLRNPNYIGLVSQGVEAVTGQLGSSPYEEQSYNLGLPWLERMYDLTTEHDPFWRDRVLTLPSHGVMLDLAEDFLPFPELERGSSKRDAKGRMRLGPKEFLPTPIPLENPFMSWMRDAYGL